jgi:hypothetical protein
MPIIDCHSANSSVLEYGIDRMSSRPFLERLLDILDDDLAAYRASCFIEFRRYGQKRTSHIASLEHEMVLALSQCEAYGTVDLGLMFASGFADCSLFAKRDFVRSCAGQEASMHSKSLLMNIADATIHHSSNSPIAKEKIYHDDVYLWRAFGSIPTYQKDPGILLWFQNKGFEDLLPKKFVEMMEKRRLQYNRDVELLLAAFKRMEDFSVRVRYEITVRLEFYADYWNMVQKIAGALNDAGPKLLDSFSNIFLVLPKQSYATYVKWSRDRWVLGDG